MINSKIIQPSILEDSLSHDIHCLLLFMTLLKDNVVVHIILAIVSCESIK